MVNKRKIQKLTERDIHNMVKYSVNRLLREKYEGFDDDFDEDEENEELDAAGAVGVATPEEIQGGEEDLWININKTFQNANYLFNKTRDERFAKISEVISNAFELFPSNADRIYMKIDYDPDAGYGG